MSWLLIDGNNWFAADYFASKGKVAGMFVRRLRDLIDQVVPSRVAVCWDARSTWRSQVSDQYKSDRDEKPDGFHQWLAEIRNDVAAVNGVHSFHVDGFEADDLIATLAKMSIDEGYKAVIFSGDRDLHQCLAKGWVSQVVCVNRSNNRLLFNTVTADMLLAKYGVQPWQWVDFQVIVGGQDGLEGCDGIGKKGAAAILAACGTLDKFYESPFTAPISSKQRNSLIAFRPKIENLRRLVTLVDSAPLPATWLQGVAA